MTQDDFTPAADDEDFLGALVDAVQVTVAPSVAESFEDLAKYFEPFEDAAEFIPIRDAAGRFWTIGGDESGYWWAISFPYEGDEHTGSVIVEKAPIRYPVTLLWEPTP